jgi:integrase
MSDVIDDHLAWCRAAGLSPRTISDREGALRRADRDLPLNLAYASRQELITWLGNPDWSLSTKETYHSHLGGFFAQAYADGLVDLNPMAEVPKARAKKGRPRPLTQLELTRVLTESVQPYQLCALVAYGSGLRCCEIANLRREDITEDYAYIREAKGGASDLTPIAPEVWEAVRDFPRGSLVEHVGGVANARWISIRCAVYWSRSLGLRGVSMHRLRHSFARRLRANGADPWTVKEALRHASIATTEIYLGATKEECANSVHALPVFQPPATA